MKNLRTAIGAIVLVSMLAISVSADGIMGADRTAPPPSIPSATSSISDEAESLDVNESYEMALILFGQFFRLL